MSTKGRDTSMKEKKVRSSTLPRKAGIGQQETKGRSPSLPRKTETVGQRGRSLNPPSILERKRTSTSLESRKVPTVPWPSSTLSRGPVRNPKKPVSPPKTKSLRRPLDRPTPPSKVMSTKSKSNPKNITTSSMKTSGPTKPMVSVTSRSPLKSKNSLNVKETNTGSKKLQTKKVLKVANEKKPIMSNALSSSQKDHNTVTHEEHNRRLHDEVKFEDGGRGLVGDQDVVESEIRCDDNVLSYDDHINQQDQADETFDSISDHLEHNIVDQENQESENEQVVQKLDVDENIEARHEDIQETNMEELEENVDVELEYQEHEETEPETEEHKLDEQEHEEMKPYEHEETDIEEEEHEETKPDEDAQTEADDVEVPEDEDTTSKEVIKSLEVVMHGKKETATYNDVIEETVSKLREQRKNRVLALAGAFETVISLESESSSPKELSPKNLSPKNY